MADSRGLAGLIGPTLIALSVSEALNSDIWANVPATQTYLAGTLWFVAGLAIVRAHHQWTPGWPMLITLVGWFAILGGLMRMFAPVLAQQSVPRPAIVMTIQGVLLMIGLILTFKAYGR